MDFSLTTVPPERQALPCVVAGVFAKRRLSEAASRLDHASRKAITGLLKRGDLEGRLGQTLLLHDLPGIAAERVLLVGCGPDEEWNEHKFREVIAKTGAVLAETGVTEAVSFLTDLPVPQRDLYWRLRQSVEVADATAYRFDRLKSKKDTPEQRLAGMRLSVPSALEDSKLSRAIMEGQAIARAVRLAKDLANSPSNYCTPAHLAAQAKAIQKAHPAVKVRVLDGAQMKRLGMGALLGVARGSHEPPLLITLEYRGTRVSKPPAVLIGKGVTFDSGGISIKPAAAMDEMKYDMAGAASVLATLQAVAELKSAQNVVGIVPATENMPDGNAIKPGDVLTSLSGQTIEVLNTDAEGRLILCDALTYAERFKPEVVIDIATLTGACVIALGAHASGLLGNDEGLCQSLLAAGTTSGDRVWQLPLWEDYQKALDSPFADMANVGGREAGTITAACFLSRFTKKLKWAHLDIAGTAWRSTNKKGATGRPVPLLVQFLLDRAGHGEIKSDGDAS
jgi:leucyl aminopeptidase